MPTNNKHDAKKRGRPRVDSEELRIRMQRPMLDALDQWINQQNNKPGRPEAVRRILREALGDG